MNKLRHLKSALLKRLAERRRLAISVSVALVGFTCGALMPYERVLAGAAVAAVAVALTQLIFNLLDKKSDGGPPPQPPETPEAPSDLV
ncbi:hypothetical protein [Streptomyces sp. CAI-85]|uniref:hypothetical protein n=1 Tax=Streptomyces sp. CAI-85 TaxID=1472662 RepID=UPI001587F4A4|nr:hypothetical protein [Streptomyces sp. CAI-85]NUV60869.1 hypothetical protein [Streptomyces sp. CAI-85]